MAGYTIRCDVIDVPGASSDFIRFIYNNEVHDEFKHPRYMKGISDDGATANPAPYLNECGLKRIKIEINTLSKVCFAQELQINVVYTDGSCPTDVIAPITVSSKPPLNAPRNPPASVPLKPPTMAPMQPTSPICSPTNEPVKLPTNVPLLPPTMTPLKSPTKVPLKLVTSSPILPLPTTAPTMKKKVCTNSFICPINSYRIPGRYCYDTFDDCQCTGDYVKDNTKKQCKPMPIKPPTNAPKRLPTNAPSLRPTNVPLVAPITVTAAAATSPTKKKKWYVCTNSYICPINSYRIAGRYCYDTFDDCECRIGFDKDKKHHLCRPKKTKGCDDKDDCYGDD